MDALTLLLERRSYSRLTEPGPSGPALDTILKAAVRVPDFQHLHPYEFLLAEGEGRERLGLLMEQAAIASGRPQADIDRARRMPMRAPLVIVVVHRARDNAIVHPIEQQLTAGCAAMAMQMAAVAQGFSGVWRSGWPMFDRHLHDALGLGPDDGIIGFLYLGTAIETPEPAPAIDPAAFTRTL
jgi:nitroreductase